MRATTSAMRAITQDAVDGRPHQSASDSPCRVPQERRTPHKHRAALQRATPCDPARGSAGWFGITMETGLLLTWSSGTLGSLALVLLSGFLSVECPLSSRFAISAACTPTNKGHEFSFKLITCEALRRPGGEDVGCSIAR